MANALKGKASVAIAWVCPNKLAYTGPAAWDCKRKIAQASG